MKYSTVIVAACIGGASLASAVQPGSNPHTQLNASRNRKPSSVSNIKHSIKRVGNNSKQFVQTAVAAKSHQRQSQHGGNLVDDVHAWDNFQPPNVGERVDIPSLDSVSRRLRKAKGPQRLPKDDDEETAFKSSMTPDAHRATQGKTLAETGSQTNPSDPVHPSPGPLPSDNEADMEARGLDIENLDARTFDAVESLLGRNFFDDVKTNYRIRKAKYYDKKAAEEKALAGIQSPSPSGGEVQAPVESLSGEVTAREYDDAELRTRDLTQSLNAAVDTIFHKKPTTSTPVAARDSLDLLSHEVEARGHDDAELDARDNIFEQIGRGVGAVVDTLKGKTSASSHSVSSIPSSDSSIATETSMSENAPLTTRDIVNQGSLESRDLSEMELFERDIDEELAARGYDVANLKARNIFLSGLKKIFSSKKSTETVHLGNSMAPSSDHSSTDAYPYAGRNVPIVQRDFDNEYLNSRDIKEDRHESRDLGEMDLLERSIHEELAARGYDDGDLEARNFLSNGLRTIFSSKKSVTPSHHSAMDAYSHGHENLSMDQHDFADSESLDTRDIEEDHHESRDLSETELLERSIREELVARGYDDGNLEARFLSGLRKIISGNKLTSSGHSSMDLYSHDDRNTTIVQRDFEEELDARDFEIDELD